MVNPHTQLLGWCSGAMVFSTMARLTISLAERTHRALKEAAARQNRSMAAIIEESLQLRGIQPVETAQELVAKARRNAGLDAEEAMALALEETGNFRAGR